MKKMSSGLILTDITVFLGCHSTGNWFYDLPKGEVEHEDPLTTCVRETKEETNLDIDPDHLEDLGIFEYNPQKNLHLFLFVTETLPDIDSMRCTSTFVDRYTKKVRPEVDGYRYIPFSEKEKYVTKNMNKVLNRVEQLLSKHV